MIVSGTISLVLPALFALITDNAWLMKGCFDKGIFWRTMKFGAPLVPAGIAVMFILVADRFMLGLLIDDKVISATMVGIFALSLRFVSITKSITAVFSLLWSPYVWRTFKEENIKVEYKHIFSCYLAALTTLSVFLILVSFLIIEHFFLEFHLSKVLIPVLISASLIYSLGDYFCIGVEIKERTQIRAYVGFLVMAINVILNLIFIPKFGVIGAAITTFVSYLVYAGSLIVISEKLFRVDYPIFPLVLYAAYLLSFLIFMDKSLMLQISYAAFGIFLVFYLERKSVRFCFGLLKRR